MKQTRNLICIFLVICLLFSLTVACGNNTATEPTQEQTQGTDPTQEQTQGTDPTHSTSGTSATEETVIPDRADNYVDFIVDVEADRDPVVLHLTDPQLEDVPTPLTPGQAEGSVKDKLDIRCYDYIRETVLATNPDLILITGDLVYGQFDPNGEAFLSLVNFMEEFQIPWAPVFGNHDNESKMGADWQCQQLEQAEHCLFLQRTLTGNGNYTVGIRQGNALKRVFFMMDSNGCTEMSEATKENGHSQKEYGFGSDQISWYKKTAEQIKALSPETKLTFAFHIQITKFATAYAKYGFTNHNTITNPINIDTHPNKADGDFGHLGRDLKGPWDADTRVWSSLRKLKVDSILVGHEHCNSASVVYEGVRFQFGQKCSTYDRFNWLMPDGSIVGTSINRPVDGVPMLGGTVMLLDKEDGSIKDPYIYLCNGLSAGN